MRNLLYIALLISASLACGATLPESQFIDAIPTPSAVYLSPTPEARYIVTADEALQIRTGAGESFPALKVFLSQGEIVTCLSIDPAQDGGRWCRHELGYSNVRYMKGIK